ncbi:SH3 domain-containing protein [Nitrosomonas sp. Nm132]|uniref:SH3 domain-containing protein n=1 Tax=Nitrosomonas sp. Nm132 TaxID=1881053 RepID=UPI000891389E|nr:SH3 domain-containing protein [Nitrosomonas sp. Nm132]SDH59082.1 SH3-like domain-containing protein [Nitrosomonas sp. Nm132]
MQRRGLIGSFFLFFLLVFPRWSVATETEFFSISENAVVMYDAPSLNAEKLYVASLHLPLEVVAKVEGWVKVRDSSGAIAWIEKKFLSDKRFVIVTAPFADVYQSADVHSPLVFQVERNVVVEWLSSDIAGWVKVRRRDGQIGYIRSNQVWGS